MLIPTITNANQLTIAIRPEHEDNPPPAPPGSVFMIPRVINAEGIVICEGGEPGPGTKAWLHNKENGYPTVEVRFGKGEVFENEPIIPTLRQLAELVSGVIDTLEAHLKGSNGEVPI